MNKTKQTNKTKTKTKTKTKQNKKNNNNNNNNNQNKTKLQTPRIVGETLKITIFLAKICKTKYLCGSDVMTDNVIER